MSTTHRCDLCRAKQGKSNLAKVYVFRTDSDPHGMGRADVCPACLDKPIRAVIGKGGKP